MCLCVCVCVCVFVCVCTALPKPVTFGPGGSAMAAKILKGVKKFCNTFLRGDFTDLDEIWHYGGIRGQQVLSDFGELWPTFSGSTNFRSQISQHFLPDSYKFLHG